MASLIPVTTTRIGGHLPLLDLLPDSRPLSWVRNGEGLVGWGVHASFSVSGRDRFEQARDWWHHQLETFSISTRTFFFSASLVLMCALTSALVLDD